jgi:hypothetical protein
MERAHKSDDSAHSGDLTVFIFENQLILKRGVNICNSGRTPALVSASFVN